MIIKNLSYEAIFQKIKKDFILDYVIGIAFNDDSTVSVILSDDVNWKIVKDLLGGVHIFAGEHKVFVEESIEQWTDEVYIEAGDYGEIIL